MWRATAVLALVALSALVRADDSGDNEDMEALANVDPSYKDQGSTQSQLMSLLAFMGCIMCCYCGITVKNYFDDLKTKEECEEHEALKNAGGAEVPTMGTATSGVSDVELKAMGDCAAVGTPGYGSNMWLAKIDDSTGQNYYFNTQTKERTWQNPTFRRTRCATSIAAGTDSGVLDSK